MTISHTPYQPHSSHIFPTIGFVPKACAVYFLWLHSRGFRKAFVWTMIYLIFWFTMIWMFLIIIFIRSLKSKFKTILHTPCQPHSSHIYLTIGFAPKACAIYFLWLHSHGFQSAVVWTMIFLIDYDLFLIIVFHSIIWIMVQTSSRASLPV